jgi:hypothetical protein
MQSIPCTAIWKSDFDFIDSTSRVNFVDKMIFPLAIGLLAQSSARIIRMCKEVYV